MACPQEVAGEHVPTSAPQCGDDSGFLSREFLEYEGAFRAYTSENLRSQDPEQDFMAVHRDAEGELRSKVARLAEWWRAARHVVVFTGAGVSTAAGLPDYRGPEGLWTRKLRGEAVSEESLLGAAGGSAPTRAHAALARLHGAGLLAHVATTNVDGLHCRAGLPREVLSELHGNLFVEECGACGARFERSHPVRTAAGLFEHGTGNACEACGGPLRDIIVNFGNTFEHVPSMEAEHDRAWMETRNADLVVVLGSSLSVPTACDLPEECIPARYQAPNGGRLVIVNLQKTPKDPLAALCIYSSCDDVTAAIEDALLADRSVEAER